MKVNLSVIITIIAFSVINGKPRVRTGRELELLIALIESAAKLNA